MIFGIKEKEINMGSFSSSACSTCKEGGPYHLIKKTRYLVAFFISLIPVGSSYRYVCGQCENEEEIDTKAGQKEAKKVFRKRRLLLAFKDILKTAVFFGVIASAIILPLALIKAPVPDPQVFKDLVSEDGLYNIADKDGSILATVQVVDGQKTLTFYDRVSVLIGEPGADGTFLMHEYYHETEDASSENGVSLQRDMDEPGFLEDRYHVPVRMYYYNAATGSLGYATGIENLSSIVYTPDQVTYTYSYYTSDTDKETYVDVLYLDNGMRLKATFTPSVPGEAPDQFFSLSIEYFDHDRISKMAAYYFEETDMDAEKSDNISMNSTADDILNFIAQAAPDPALTAEFTYYENTNVLTSSLVSGPGESSDSDSIFQSYTVTEKSGYYIQQADET